MNTKTKKLFTKLFLLILAMVMSFSLFLFNACGTDSTENTDEDKESESSLPVDESYLKNGSFSFFTTTDEKASYPRTPQNWKYAVDSGASSSSSNLTKGILNVSDSSFETDANKQLFPRDDTDPSKKWTVNATGDYVNPGKPQEAEDDYILMINNKAKTNETAGRYTSDSFFLPQSSMVLLTGYVKTYLPQDSAFGAHINITGSLPDSERILVKDIKTNGEWKKFSIVIRSSEISSSDIQIQLGLGYGDNNYEIEYTKGFAFFDDVKATFLEKKDFLTAYGNSTDKFRADTTEKADNVATIGDLSESDTISVGYDCVKIDPEHTNSNQNFDSNTENFVDARGNSVSAVNYTDITDSLKETDKTDTQLTSPFSASDQVLRLYNPETVNERTDVRYTNNSGILTVKTGSYYRVSVWVKTTDMRAGTGLAIYLYPLKNGQPDSSYNAMTFKNINTASSNVDINTKSNYNNKYQNWKQYSFFIEGSDFADVTYGIEFRLGPNTPIGIEVPNASDIPYGTAIVNDIDIERIAQSEYNYVTAGTYVATQSLKQASSVGITNGDFSSITKDSNSFETTDFSKPIFANGWNIYQQGEKAVGGDNAIDVPNTSNDFAYGIIDSNHFDSLNTEYKPNNLSTDNFGKGAPRVYMMYNKSATALGIRSSAISVSSSSYVRISARVYVGNGAKANVYLVDEDGAIVGIPDGEKLGTKTFAYKNQEYTAESGAGFADSNLGEGWREFSFFVKTGDLSKSYSVEIWNGAREKAEGNNDLSTGFVLVDNVKIESLTVANFESDKTANESKGNMLFADFSDMDVADDEEDSADETLPEEQFANEFNWSLLGILIFSSLMIVGLVVVIIKKATSKGHYKLKAKTASKNYDANVYENSDSDNEDTSTDTTDDKKE